MMEFLIYAPRKRRFPCPEFTKYDTEIVVTLPDNSRGFFCSKYRYNKKEFSCKKEELWIGILNKSLSEDIAIEKGKALGFFPLKTSKKSNIKHETATSRNNKKKICKRQRQRGDLLSRYDFAYAGTIMDKKYKTNSSFHVK